MSTLQRSDKVLIIRPKEDLKDRIGPERTGRLGEVLEFALDGIDHELIEKVANIPDGYMKGRKVIFAICLSEVGINIEYYRLLEYFRANPDCLEGATGGIIVDGASEFFTKALARRLAFSANLAGCVFPGKPLVEATGSLGNFHVLSKITGQPKFEVYKNNAKSLIIKVRDFEYPDVEAKDVTKLLVVHASSRKTSNSLLLWDKIKQNLDPRVDIREVSLRDGSVEDCRGCKYEDCLHFGEQGRCFYGGIITEQVFPSLIECDALIMICPNYNDAVSANMTAMINRLTSMFRAHDFSQKRVYALVISGYSGSDIIAEQLIGALNFNKAFILPSKFAMLETANDPKSILEVEDIDNKAAEFAARIR